MAARQFKPNHGGGLGCTSRDRVGRNLQTKARKIERQLSSNSFTVIAAAVLIHVFLKRRAPMHEGGPATITVIRPSRRAAPQRASAAPTQAQRAKRMRVPVTKVGNNSVGAPTLLADSMLVITRARVITEEGPRNIPLSIIHCTGTNDAAVKAAPTPSSRWITTGLTGRGKPIHRIASPRRWLLYSAVDSVVQPSEQAGTATKLTHGRPQPALDSKG